MKKRGNGGMHLFAGSASHYSSTPESSASLRLAFLLKRQARTHALLYEDFPGAATNMFILRQIYFRDRCASIGERANTLDRIESNVRDVLCPQPFPERPTLKGDWQRTKLYHGEICMCRITQFALDPFLFISSNDSRSPNVLADVAAKHFLQIRNDPMSNAVAQRCEIFVRSILAKFQPVLAEVVIDLFAPDAKKRAHDRQVDAVDSSCRNFPHRSKAGAAGATKQIDQKRFDQI